MTTSLTRPITDAPRLQVEVDASRVHAWSAEVAADPTTPVSEVLARLVGEDAALGTQRTVLAEHAEQAFLGDAMAEAGTREHLVETAEQLVREAAVRADRATDLLGGTFFDQDLRLTTILLPATRICYGLPGGGQVFGLVPTATVREACCFLEHTFYHELSDQWASERTARSEREQTSTDAVVTWILSLVRNEGVANWFCLDELASMPADTPWTYFSYAPLIGNDDATVACLDKLAQALDVVAGRAVADATAFVNGTLKNPDLPLLNLAGIHVVRTLVESSSEAAVAALCHDEPEVLLAAWLDSPDPLLGRLAPGAVERLRHWAQVRW